MRWLKHLSGARRDEKLADLYSQHGFEGYGFYWALVETVAESMDRGERCHLTHRLSQWARTMQCHQNRVSKYLVTLRSLGLIEVSVGGVEGGVEGGVSEGLRGEWSLGDGNSYVTVSVPNLLKYRDEYSKKSGVHPDKVPSKIEKHSSQEEIPQEEKTPTESKRSASPKSGSATTHGSRFGLESLPEEWAAYCAADLKWAAETTAGTFANFSDYWNSKAGAGARKTNWLATWRIWCRNEEKNNAAHAAVLQMRPQERAGSARDTGPTQRAIDEGNRRMAKNGRLY